MMAILVEENNDSEEDNTHDNRKAVLIDDLEDCEYKFKEGTAGGSAGRRFKGDSEEGEECVEEQVEQREE